MSYTLTNWQDEPSEATPLTASNMLLYNAAINDLDDRVAQAASVLTVTTVATSNYTALAQQFVPVSTVAGPVTITLPASPPDLTQIGVKHVARLGSNAVTIAAAGSDTFNTSTGPVVISLPSLSQSALLQYVDAQGLWIVISEDTPLSQTTARSIAMSMVLGAFSP
jgi:hypothetical protein